MIRPSSRFASTQDIQALAEAEWKWYKVCQALAALYEIHYADEPEDEAIHELMEAYSHWLD